MADNSGGILRPCLRNFSSKAIQKNKGEIKVYENRVLSPTHHTESKDINVKVRTDPNLNTFSLLSPPAPTPGLASATANRGELPGGEKELVTGPEAGLKPLPGRPRPPRSEDTDTGDQGKQSAGHRARLKDTGKCLQKTEEIDVASGHRQGEKKQTGKISGPINKTRSPNVSYRHPTSKTFRKAETLNDGPRACCLSINSFIGTWLQPCI